eukprot:COSAG01_NODE_107_length_25964_cov_174.577576_7_plen_67_part_00
MTTVGLGRTALTRAVKAAAAHHLLPHFGARSRRPLGSTSEMRPLSRISFSSSLKPTVRSLICDLST